VLTIVLCNCALRGGEPVWLETRKTLLILKRFCDFNECVHLTVDIVIVVIMRGMENGKYIFFFCCHRTSGFRIIEEYSPEDQPASCTMNAGFFLG